MIERSSSGSSALISLLLDYELAHCSIFVGFAPKRGENDIRWRTEHIARNF